ncbi:Helix-turn-helix, AraC domain-containing protein (plasmid) [Gemmatirosa kalamazoonensis]|uniref:Helix-turn-helix, AraC domain-containing protein n=2 Tax=Gemmatirosa kalamazoonensis TaxID=861299 RepID=W0RQI3_9BACT|nr:Helix-turn-helix, AraC domain-containing protein [Gemmatirosa kalamazoonensis]
MLQTRMAPPSAVLRPYGWAYGMTTGRVDGASLVIPLPARPKQLLTFSFADGYRALRCGSGQTDPTPRVVVVGPQSYARPGLSALGRIDHFTIHFQPSGFHRLFGVPMTELADAAYDAHGVIGPEVSALERRLGETPSFVERIRLAEAHLIRLLRDHGRPDPVGCAANGLFARHGVQRVSAMASDTGLSTRQFERRFLRHVGVPPKLYARIIRFNAVLDHKLRHPGRAWSRIASDHDYYDQMHLVHDCRAFTGESPSRLLARLSDLPAFHTFYATADRPRRD